MDGILDGLNEAQRAAVTSVASVVQVLAPPGSGKTKTLTARVGHLIAHNGFLPQNIIVCTFTVKAAREMQERISDFLGKEVASKLVLGTFHSISRRFLAIYGKRINLDNKFSIADTSDTLAILTRIIKKRNFTIDSKAARSRISTLKSQSVSPEQFIATAKQEEQQEIAKIYSEYQEHLTLSSLLDFDDLLLRCAELLRRSPSCVTNIDAVLIDEFQDTNNVQYDLMSLFAQSHQNITIVGDPDQSIYGWRNAETRNLSRMQEEYPGIHVAKLEENYRSSGAILMSAQEVIEQDQSRPAKRLMPTHSVGMRPVLRRLPNAAVEAAWLIAEVQRVMLLTGDLLRWSDCAVLLRSASLSRHIESALGKAGIPYKMVGGHKFFDRLEVKLILDYLRVISHPDHNDALARVINVPSRKIGEVTVQKLLDVAAERKITLWKLVLGLAQNHTKIQPCFSASTQKGLEAFVNIILTGRNKLADAAQSSTSLADFVMFVVKKIRLADHLQKTKPEDLETRWANVEELIAQASDFTVVQESLDGSPQDGNLAEGLQLQESRRSDSLSDALANFLSNVALTSETQKTTEADAPAEQLTISTIHAAKGLEWPVVFIPGVYAGSLPHSRAENTDEERRLLYVAMTRAQCLLYLSCPLQDSQGKDTTLSPFLAQGHMDSYFDKCGAGLGFSEVTELSRILRRKQPSKQSVAAAMATCERLSDDYWALDGSGAAHTVGFDAKGGTDWTSGAQKGVSAMTTMQQQKGSSISMTEKGSTFVTASTVLMAFKEAESLSMSKLQSTNTTSSFKIVPQKRKMESRKGTASNQSSISGFFSAKTTKTTTTISARESPRRDEDRYVPSVMSRTPFINTAISVTNSTMGSDTKSRLSATNSRPLQDIINTVNTDRSSEAVRDDEDHTEKHQIMRPANTFHQTTVSSMQQMPPRKTLGVRKTFVAWSARPRSNMGDASSSGLGRVPP